MKTNRALTQTPAGTTTKAPGSGTSDRRGRAEPLDDCGQEDVEEEEEEIVGLHVETASFDEIISWAHESLPDGANDAQMKGVEEWIRFAEKVSMIVTF